MSIKSTTQNTTNVARTTPKVVNTAKAVRATSTTPTPIRSADAAVRTIIKESTSSKLTTSKLTTSKPATTKKSTTSKKPTDSTKGPTSGGIRKTTTARPTTGHTLAPPPWAKRKPIVSPPTAMSSFAPIPKKLTLLEELMAMITPATCRQLPSKFHDDPRLNIIGHVEHAINEWYHAMPEWAIKDVVWAANATRMLNGIHIETVPRGMPVPAHIEELRNAYCQVLETIKWRFHCAIVNYDNEISARYYVADNFHGGIIDGPHWNPINMAAAEIRNLDWHIIQIEHIMDAAKLAHVDKPTLPQFVFVDSRRAVSNTGAVVPAECIPQVIARRGGRPATPIAVGTS